MSTPAFGLLLDVDGPIASPVSRTVAVESIGRDLVLMANRGIPVIFNTGRSDTFIAEQVVPVLRAAGLEPATPVYTVSEKGAVWAEVTPEGLGEVSVDAELKLPEALSEEVRQLVAERFSGLMFFDETKRAMVSVEQHVHVPPRSTCGRRRSSTPPCPRCWRSTGWTGCGSTDDHLHGCGA